MNNFSHIQQKLHGFIKKYDTNEIIKGSILFVSFGLLYFIFTLFLEYFLWLKPLARSVLFWVFVLVELALLIKFIIRPFLRLSGLQKGLSFSEASKIIGKHFKEVDDQLLNILQLQDSYNKGKDPDTDLLMASIEQKAAKINPIPFKNAINYGSNKKYFKYLSIPLIIGLLIFLSGNTDVFTQSLNRVVHHKTAYSPPAPFEFEILNTNLKTVEGKTYQLEIRTIGDVVPENVSIHFNDESFYIERKQQKEFVYSFIAPERDISFYLEGNNVVSQIFKLEVIAAPRIIDFQMALDFPDYTRKKNESINNTGNATLPEGTEVTWIIRAQNTDKIHFVDKNDFQDFGELLETQKRDVFNIQKQIKKDVVYQINTSNDHLKKFESLEYQLKIIKDRFPEIKIKSDIDSVSRGPVQFAGRLTDDYGIKKLQVVAKNLNDKKLSISNIAVGDSDLEEFYYVFPSGLFLEDGAAYEVYFEVFDNDGINGSKKSVSESFFYNNKTDELIQEEILLEQKQTMESIESDANSIKEMQEKLDDFSRRLKNNKNTDWNNKKELNQFIDRQKKYQQMIEKNSDELLKNLNEMDMEKDADLEDKKQALKKRIEENKALQKQQDLLKELNDLAEKLKNEDLLKKLDKLSEQNKQELRSLERILELTKRFYVEKKSAQIVHKLDTLAQKESELSKKEKNTSKQQKGLNDEFDAIKKDLKELNEQNKKLKQPLNFEDTKTDEQLIQMALEKALEQLEKNEQSPNGANDESKEKAKQAQKEAAKKLKELSKKMQNDLMAMEMETHEENMKDLEQILENLIVFSFNQEALMLDFDGLDAKHSQYPEKLKEQIKLKEHFEHIDDSLYTLSLRLVRLSSRIQKDLSEAHFNIDKSLEHIAENNIKAGIVNQQYTMTAANNLADLLSDLLQSLQNKKPGSGKGKGKKGEELSLPDIIKKQGELIEKMKKGGEPGEKGGEKNTERMSGEQFEIYQEQNLLKESLKEILNDGQGDSQQEKKVLDQMDVLEKLLLEQGLTKKTIERMEQLNYELLKLENATLQQNNDSKRNSESNSKLIEKREINPIQTKKLYFDENEILIRQNLNLQPLYLDKLKTYFKD